MYCMSLNKLGAFVSTTHLKVKFLLEDGLVSTISINQEIAPHVDHMGWSILARPEHLNALSAVSSR
ncbi:hypothetical protein JHK85_010146 [Glycine max]|nr:hypothetical protein JHK85_010146 [Glycine max]